MKYAICNTCQWKTDSAMCEECTRTSRNVFPSKYANNPLDQLVSQAQELDMGYDNVKKPKHYQLCDMEALDIIKMTLSPEEFKGYILGNILKYRLRAGKKGGMSQTYEDISKANEYEEMYDRHFG